MSKPMTHSQRARLNLAREYRNIAIDQANEELMEVVAGLRLNGVSMAEMAKELGYTPQYMYQLFNGTKPTKKARTG